jgi:hypothetical protein
MKRGKGDFMTRATVFFSWQSDIRAAACRTIIQDALEAAAKTIAADESVAITPVIDRDTQGVPGAPDIGATILTKIDAAAAFVADVTIVGRTNGGKAMPNPNVLVELGYALSALGWSRIVLVQNTAFGEPEQLPFDLRQKRAITYSSPEDATERAQARRGLQRTFEAALSTMLKSAEPKSSSVTEFTLTHRRDKTEQNFHHCGITPALKNVGQRRIDDWQIELEFPSVFLDGVIYGLKVDDRSTRTHSLFQRDGRRRGAEKPLFPDQVGEFTIGYHVTTDLFRQRELFDLPVRARALVDGKVVAEVTKPFSDFEEF